MTERNAEVDRVKLEMGYSLDMPLAEEGLYWLRKALEECEARERAERLAERQGEALKVALAYFALVDNANNPKELAQKAVELVDAIFVKAQEVRDVQP